jgi:predicted RNA-binding Zn ribbon-like protein
VSDITGSTFDAALVGFEFGGRLSLDFTWTVRFRAVIPTELLVSPERLGEWVEAAGFPSGPTDAAELRAARMLREAIYRAASDTLDGGALRRHDLTAINRWAAEPSVAARLRADGTKQLLAKRGTETAAALATVARDAIDVLAAGDGRLRRCEGPSCSLLFHDSSRPGTRRWCITERCGNKVNTKAYRARLDSFDGP